ncbi:receptor for retinol uptake STRA6 [Geospiza fortis]|uniref:Receptor for retinol uptake STRA6 n=1 Tax=Geospiza fortis TaxID=48883 RepID=A0A8N5EZQ3_GEOFO|nr:receptor for retinol uptake STRA6 [Geospiza fortis]
MAPNGSVGFRDSPVEPGIFLDEDLGSDWYIYESTESAPHDDLFPDAVPECHPTISPQMYHTVMAPISLALILALSFLVKRRRLHLSCWNGVPGLLSPGNLLEQDGHRAVAAAVLALLCGGSDPVGIGIGIGTGIGIGIRTRTGTRIRITIGIRIRVRIRTESLIGIGVGIGITIGISTKTGTRIRIRIGIESLIGIGVRIRITIGVEPDWDRDRDRDQGSHRGLGTKSHFIPTFPYQHSICWPGLGNSCWDTPGMRGWPGRFCHPKSIRYPQISGKSYYRKYLKALLSKRDRKGSSLKMDESLSSRIRSYLLSYIYIPEEGFRIPLKLVASVTVAVVAVYQVAVLLLVAVVPPLRIVRAGMSKDVVVLLVQFGLVPSRGAAAPGDLEQELRTAQHFLWALEVCYICSLVLCCLLTCAMLLRSLAMHRSNLRALYQGAVLDVFSKAHILRPSRESLVCWMAFSSFQAAFACLGLLIQQVIFFLCFVAFTFLVVIPLQLGTSSPLFGIIRNMWPFWLTLVVAVLLQHLLAHSQFLEQHSLQKEITNRRALYIVTFLLFPTNVLVGAMAAVWRVVISGLYNTVHLCRLDISLLHRGVETFDPGYRTYCHYLRVEVSQCHPLLKAFCFLLLQPGRPEPPAPPCDTQLEEGAQLIHPKPLAPGRARSRRIRARWWVAYTLLHNPSLTASRKTALADPAANGAQLGVPRP